MNREELIKALIADEPFASGEQKKTLRGYYETMSVAELEEKAKSITCKPFVVKMPRIKVDKVITKEQKIKHLDWSHVIIKPIEVSIDEVLRRRNDVLSVSMLDDIILIQPSLNADRKAIEKLLEDSDKEYIIKH